MRSMDWGETSLGPVEAWPESLQTTVSICLGSKLPILICWGSKLVKLYNDAYRPIIGDKHPAAMGTPGREAWPEIWDSIGSTFEGAVNTGEATSSENQLLLLDRHGFREECYFTFSCSPIRDEADGIGGVLCVATETTACVVDGRRLHTQQALAAATSQAGMMEEVWRRASLVLEDNGADVPFCLFYSLQGRERQARLVAASGVARTSAALETLRLADAPWALGQLGSGQEAVIPCADVGLSIKPDRPPCTSALALPVVQPGASLPSGYIVAGISSRRPFDDKYRAYLRAIAGQLVSATTRVQAARVAERIKPRGAARADAAPHQSGALRRLFSDSEPANGKPASGPPTLDSRKAEVLIVDNNADRRRFLQSLLSPCYRVEMAATAQEALDRAQANVPDLVLCDLGMPNTKGLEFVQRLRSDEGTHDVPIIMLSASGGEQALADGLEDGADDHLVEPVEARQLLARVRLHLDLARARRDRTELVLREQRARIEADLQREHLTSLFMQTPSPIAILRGPEHVIQLVNRHALEAWRSEHAEVVGLPLAQAFPDLGGPVLQAALKYVLSSARPCVKSEALVGGDEDEEGESRGLYFNFVCAPLKNADGLVDGVLVLATDVSEQVHARKRSKELQERAESANRAKDEFLAMLGHELRNPLAPITTVLELMRLRGGDQFKEERALLERQTAQLIGLVDDLLDVSRLTRGKVVLNKQRVDIGDVIEAAIEMVSPLLDKRRHHLTVELSEESLHVNGDRARLTQIVSNLLSNAAKYTEPGGEIAIAVSRPNGAARIKVTDTGVGIRAEQLPKVFDMFSQGRQALDRADGGLGLGLTIVQNLTALHGGSVWATSDGEGHGSTFAVELPLLTVSETGPAVHEEVPPSPRIAASPQKVLVVDDNEDAATTLAHYVTRMGHVVRVTHDGPSALRVAREFAPDVALLDIGLPAMDGYELGARLRRRPELRNIRLVAISGYSRQIDPRRGADNKFEAHLVKPVNLDRLLGLIEA